MKIDNTLASGVPPAPQSNHLPPADAAGFQAALARAQNEHSKHTGTAPAAREAQRAKEEAKQAEAARAAHEALWAEFRDYMNKTPAELMRERVLKELGISEEELAAMPPEKRLAMESEISERVKEKLLGKAREGEEETSPTLNASATSATLPTASYQLSQISPAPLLASDLTA